MIENSKLIETTYNYLTNNMNKNYFAVMNSKEITENFEFFGFRQKNIQDIIDNGPPKLENYDEYNFGMVKILENEKDLKTYIVSFFITKNILIFVYENLVPIIDKIKDDLVCSKSQRKLYKDKILYMLFDRMTDNNFKHLEDIESKITQIEDLIIEEKKYDYIKQIVIFRKKLLFLKGYYEHLLDIFETIEQNENDIIDDKIIVFFKILTNRVERLSRNVQNLRDYVTQVREAYQAQVDISANYIMKIFTVVTSIFLPLTLIAGWYGMNFKYMPELSSKLGYPFVICLSIVVAVLFIIYFKKKKFL